jgi:hypothetical protein
MILRKISDSTNPYRDCTEASSSLLHTPISRTLHHSHLLLTVSMFLLCDQRPGEQTYLTLSLTLSLHYCCICSPGHCMDPLESYRLTVRNLLGAALCEHRGSRRWHYAIDMEKTNQDSWRHTSGWPSKSFVPCC